MPEGPEAEICRAQLERWTLNKQIQSVELFDDACVRHKRSTRPRDVHPNGRDWVQAEVVGSRVRAVYRHGKRVGLDFGLAGLLLHLGMTGKWIRIPTVTERQDLKIAFQLSEYWVGFIDPRRFGSLVPVSGSLLGGLREGLGPDALSGGWSGSELSSRFRGRRPIKVALMDQSCVAGIGNIHAVEILWKSGVHPKRPVESISPAEWSRLAQVIPTHLNGVVETQMTDEMIYITQGGPNEFSVYGRSGGICPRCNEKIRTEIIQGRNTFFCFFCQVF